MVSALCTTRVCDMHYTLYNRINLPQAAQTVLDRGDPLHHAIRPPHVERATPFPRHPRRRHGIAQRTRSALLVRRVFDLTAECHPHSPVYLGPTTDRTIAILGHRRLPQHNATHRRFQFLNCRWRNRSHPSNRIETSDWLVDNRDARDDVVCATTAVADTVGVASPSPSSSVKVKADRSTSAPTKLSLRRSSAPSCSSSTDDDEVADVCAQDSVAGSVRLVKLGPSGPCWFASCVLGQ